MTLFRTGCAALALIAATPALAQAPSEAGLAALVRAQAAEIAALKSRLDRLENNAAVAQASAPVAPVQVAPQRSRRTPNRVARCRSRRSSRPPARPIAASRRRSPRATIRRA